MTHRGPRDGASVRRDLRHPVIDADGHWTELYPIFFDFIREVAGLQAMETFRSRYGQRFHAWYAASPAERQRRRLRRPAFWGVPAQTHDRAAACIPALFRERLDDWGIDLAIVYPSIGLTLGRDVSDPDLIAGVIRAYNAMAAEMFAAHADRIVPVGVISLADPKEAVSQLEHAHALGLRAVTTGGPVARDIEQDAEWQPEAARRRVYLDGIGLDSPHDYDPLWRRFVELRMPVASHGGSMGWPDRSSPTSFVANHVGHFAQSHHLFARSLFLGGVSERFPELNFAFLEGGVGWACNLYSDLIGHWEKRNRAYMAERLRPTNIDRVELRRLFERYTAGNPRFTGKLDDILARNLDNLECDITQEELTERDRDADEFAHVHIEERDDIRRLFAERFYFGCEADDPLIALAFDADLGLQLRPLLGSDISHFDVPDASQVLGEAWELVEDGLIDQADFRELTFANAVRLYGTMNPEFFRGTILADDARRELEQGAR
jgi:predicted TIM-barrel fold metal-dependent hydrolase